MLFSLCQKKVCNFFDWNHIPTMSNCLNIWNWLSFFFCFHFIILIVSCLSIWIAIFLGIYLTIWQACYLPLEPSNKEFLILYSYFHPWHRIQSQLFSPDHSYPTKYYQTEIKRKLVTILIHWKCSMNKITFSSYIDRL